MWTALCLAALVATAVGSPFGTALKGKSNGLDAHSYSLEVRKGLSTLGPAALVFDEYAICSASILRGAEASALSVRIGSRIFFNLFGESVKVSEVLLHPDGADVAVLKLQKPVSYKSASSIAVVGPEGAAPGTRVQVSSWNFASFLKVADEWLVLPKYCARPGLCATGAAGTGALVSADGQLVGLAGSSKGNGSVGGVESIVDLAERSVQKFIAVATNRVPPTPPTPPTPPPPPPTPATETPATETPPTEATTASPATEPTAPTVPTPTKRPSGKTCAISTKKGLPSQEPILLREQDANTAALTFRDPDQADTIELASGERVVIVCSGSSNYLNLDKKLQEAVVECVEDTTFLFKGKEVEWSSLGCKTMAANSARRAGKCGNSGEFSRIEIGFQATSGFAVQIENCFNSVTFDAVYSRMNMTPAIAGHESGGKRPQFTPAGFYEGFDPNNLYKNTAQKKTVGELLGDPSLGNKYIQDGSKSSYFLARGHLSAKADYILDAQQRATFYYINVAPQWQTFNAKNWENLEDSVRRWVVSSGRSVQVVTGTWGVATLPNKDGVETELYLGGSKKTLRVPKYYWKVVYDPATKEGAVFVGLNNPYHVTTDEDVFCKDECARYSWLSWVQKDQEKGYSFCCDVNEFRKTVTTLPNDIDVKALL